jgi:hypothetical protein
MAINIPSGWCVKKQLHLAIEDLFAAYPNIKSFYDSKMMVYHLCTSKWRSVHA